LRFSRRLCSARNPRENQNRNPDGPHIAEDGSSEGEVDLAQLVASSDGYSPADIEFAARSASQSALEQSVFGAPGGSIRGPSTDDYLTAIARTRATVSATVASEFRDDIAALART